MEFSIFLENCTSIPESAVRELLARGLDETSADRVVKRFALQARRLNLDLKQRREEEVLALKHTLENVFLEIEGFEGTEIDSILDQFLPIPGSIGGILQPFGKLSITRGRDTSAGHRTNDAGVGEGGRPVNYYNQQFFNQVAGPIIQSVQGTVNFGPEARQLLDLIRQFGGDECSQLETAVYELEDEGARRTERIDARGRLKRFLADLGNRGITISLAILQKYIEHKIGMS